MDKTLVNHQIVVMRKHVRMAKWQVRQKLFKQVNLLKKKIENYQKRQQETSSSSNDVDKLKKKIISRQKEIAELKPLDQDLISKKALSHELDHFNAILQKPDQPMLDRLTALICTTKLIQSAVKQFRQDNPNSELWLPQQLELWEQKNKNGGKLKKKKKIEGKDSEKKNANTKSKPKQVQQPQSTKAATTTPAKSKPTVLSSPSSPTKAASKFNVTDKNEKKAVSTPTSNIKPKKPLPGSQFKITPLLENKPIEPKISAGPTFRSGSAVIKRIDLGNTLASSKLFDTKDEDNDDESSEDVSIPTTKRKDAFFLKENGDEVSEDDDEDDADEGEEEATKAPKFVKGGQQNNKFGGKNLDNRNQNSRPSFNNNPKKSFGGFNNNKSPFQKRDFKSPGGKQQQQQRPGQSPQATGSGTPQDKQNGGGANLHPSWKAKMAEKDKMQKISFGGNSANKKIKFD